MTDEQNPSAERAVCRPPWHVGPVRVVAHWGKGGRFRARECAHCGLRWRERMLTFGRGYQKWRRSIVTLEDLDKP